MSSTVFVVSPDNKLQALRRAPYDSEDLFQRLLGDHPVLLQQVAGPEGRLLLIRREAPVPEAMDGNGSGRSIISSWTEVACQFS